MSQQVTFYSWREGKPSSEKILVSGGQRVKDANNNILALPIKEAHFNQGLYRTDDPEIIESLRKLITRGKNDMSENREDYLKATLPIEKQSARNAALLAEKEKEIETSRKEVSELRKQLEDKAKAASKNKD